MLLPRSTCYLHPFLVLEGNAIRFYSLPCLYDDKLHYEGHTVFLTRLGDYAMTIADSAEKRNGSCVGGALPSFPDTSSKTGLDTILQVSVDDVSSSPSNVRRLRVDRLGGMFTLVGGLTIELKSYSLTLSHD